MKLRRFWGLVGVGVSLCELVGSSASAAGEEIVEMSPYLQSVGPPDIQ